jgi:hypothetical protein
MPPAKATGTPDPAAIAVIRGWANALRSGNVDGAAAYFAIPSEFANGPAPNGQVPVLEIKSRKAARLLNQSLPCGARYLSARQRGR